MCCCPQQAKSHCHILMLLHLPNHKTKNQGETWSFCRRMSPFESEAVHRQSEKRNESCFCSFATDGICQMFYNTTYTDASSLCLCECAREKKKTAAVLLVVQWQKLTGMYAVSLLFSDSNLQHFIKKFWDWDHHSLISTQMERKSDCSLGRVTQGLVAIQCAFRSLC